jgi:hypothetical protein
MELFAEILLLVPPADTEHSPKILSEPLHKAKSRTQVRLLPHILQ